MTFSTKVRVRDLRIFRNPWIGPIYHSLKYRDESVNQSINQSIHQSIHQSASFLRSRPTRVHVNKEQDNKMQYIGQAYSNCRHIIREDTHITVARGYAGGGANPL